MSAPELSSVWHLVNAAAPAMRKLMGRVAAGQLTPGEAIDVLLDWPNLGAPVYDISRVCGDTTGPNGLGGECVLGPGHPHRDGIGGEWGGEPQRRGHTVRTITKGPDGFDVFGPERPCGVCGGPGE